MPESDLSKWRDDDVVKDSHEFNPFSMVEPLYRDKRQNREENEIEESEDTDMLEVCFLSVFYQ